jgi:L-ascorbate metabolism protein UlaG (beta-lactamase superfamily)
MGDHPTGAPGRPTIQVTATPCRHGPPLSRPIAGEVVGFALGWEGQKHGVLWITGDTVLYDGVRQVADRLQVATAVLHLGCVCFPVTGPVRYSMTAQEAVELCRLVRSRTAIPVHYEGWSHFHQDRSAIEGEFAQAPADLGRRPNGAHRRQHQHRRVSTPVLVLEGRCQNA